MPINENSPTMKTVRACLYTGLFTALASLGAAEMIHWAEEKPCDPAENAVFQAKPAPAGIKAGPA